MFFRDLAFSGAFVTESAGSEVLAIQKNIKSDNEIGNIVQAVFDDVFAIESPKIVSSPVSAKQKNVICCFCAIWQHIHLCFPTQEANLSEEVEDSPDFWAGLVQSYNSSVVCNTDIPLAFPIKVRAPRSSVWPLYSLSFICVTSQLLDGNMPNTINFLLKVYAQDAKKKKIYEKERARAWDEVSFYFLLLTNVDIF